MLSTPKIQDQHSLPEEQQNVPCVPIILLFILLLQAPNSLPGLDGTPYHHLSSLVSLGVLPQPYSLSQSLQLVISLLEGPPGLEGPH
ncbi:hypothetical protein AAFF_G00234720 [Aldrovandia affinis]|uniref:Uncharacterized protein n=1 Tax=Aldrovandia affinis TaxID=143900 RepID=A0AAD7WUZ7_9TELE|nr:hypothetical protein AAFF_G00234720 [Aldrovandia affinis]